MKTSHVKPFTGTQMSARSQPARFEGLRRANCVDVAPFKEKSSSKVRSCSTRPARAVTVRAGGYEFGGYGSGGKKILMLGGTRFIGVYLARLLVAEGHQVTLLTRGKRPITFQIPDDSFEFYNQYSAAIKHLKADRKNADEMRAVLSRTNFDVVYDMNGRESSETDPVIQGLPGIQQYIFCSSAGVYLKSDEMPHREEDAVDPKSRHKGKNDTEQYLDRSGVNWTSVRPVYIYGPLNYNPVEEWFFHRLKAGRPIPVPGSGMQVTQLGHVKDLAVAFLKMLDNRVASRQVYNISGERFVTFDGIARACAEAMDLPEPELIHFNAKDYDFGKKKAFPMRDQHFFASIDKAMKDLDWKPEFGLVDGLRDSYVKDFGRGTYRKDPDFSTDDMIIEKVKGRSPSYAKKSAW